MIPLGGLSNIQTPIRMGSGSSVLEQKSNSSLIQTRVLGSELLQEKGSVSLSSAPFCSANPVISVLAASLWFLSGSVKNFHTLGHQSELLSVEQPLFVLKDPNSSSGLNTGSFPSVSIATCDILASLAMMLHQLWLNL